ncbi:MAG TPA: proline--tRNA ligase, partial [Solibacterales bacterium]|nr:proline--tRNA ligase [Bryobacterales bacterium]
IGIERILSSAVELYHDADGMALPASIAPFEAVVTPVNNNDAALRGAADELYRSLRAAGVDALYDD